MKFLYVILIIITILIIYLFILNNTLVKLKNKVEEAFATMDVYLKKRWDLIPNLVEIVKSYAKYEQNTFEDITKLRNTIYENMSNEEKIKSQNELTTNFTKLLALAEAYPEIKANNNFLDLSKNLTKIEDELANSRKYYNAVIRMYNNKVEIFPNNLFAKILGYKSLSMFEIKPLEKENIEVKL